jgi:putative ABC transport system permease protein
VKMLLLSAGLRFYRQRPWQLALAIAGIGLGVAVYVGVALANDSARRAFETSSSELVGRATHELLPTSGDLAETVYSDLVRERGVRHAAPVLEGRIRLLALPAQRFNLIGIDPLAERTFRALPQAAPAAGRGVLSGLIARPGAALVPAALARELGASEGMVLPLADASGTRHALEVLGIVGDADRSDGGSGPIIVDIATAQELLGKRGALSRIDLMLEKSQADALAAKPPPGTTLVPAEGRDRAFAELTRAFRVNLTALSLLALFVGVFLIYATMAFAIVQRRTTFGTLRAMGLDRRELAASLLVEALAIGSAATVLGVILGHALARELVGLVLRTISDLSFRNAVASVPPSPAIYWQGGALGVLATLAGAFGPALDAAHTEPRAVLSRAALERRAVHRGRIAAAAALPALLGAGLLLSMDTGLVSAFAALFLVLAAGALVTPLATVWLMRVCEPLARRVFGLAGSLAVRGVQASMSRTGVAVAALTVAVATVIGIGTMTASFRESFAAWLDVTLRADLYLADPGGSGELDDTLLRRLGALPRVVGTSATRGARLPTPKGNIDLRALRPGPRGWGLDILTSAPEHALEGIERGDGVMVSEALAFRLGLKAGEPLTLPAATGPVALTVLGVFRDYSAEGGVVLIDLDLYRRLWSDTQLSGIGVYLGAGADEQAARAAIEKVLVDRPEIRVRANNTIRRMSLEIFDRTFAITEVLRILAGLVAFLGMLSALTAIQLERARERALLRAIGFRAADIRWLTLAQTSLLGFSAGMLALPLGTVLAALLVFVINRRSFGWSMELNLQLVPLLLGVALAVVAALLAGVYPALRSAAVPPAEALRSE